jgi:hypothetical protein
MMQPLDKRWESKINTDTATIQLERKEIDGRHWGWLGDSPWGWLGSLPPQKIDFKKEVSEFLGNCQEPRAIIALGHRFEEARCNKNSCTCMEVKEHLVGKTIEWLEDGACAFRVSRDYGTWGKKNERKRKKMTNKVEMWWHFERKLKCLGECSFCAAVSVSLARTAQMAEANDPVATFPRMAKLMEIKAEEEKVFKKYEQGTGEDDEKEEPNKKHVRA